MCVFTFLVMSQIGKFWLQFLLSLSPCVLSGMRPGSLSKLQWDKLAALTEEYQDIEYVKKTEVDDMKDVAVVDGHLVDVTKCDSVLGELTKELQRRDELKVVADRKVLVAAMKAVNSRKARLGTLKSWLSAERSSLMDRRSIMNTANGSHDGEESSSRTRGPAFSREKQNGVGDDFSSSLAPELSATTATPIMSEKATTEVLPFVTVTVTRLSLSMLFRRTKKVKMPRSLMNKTAKKMLQVQKKKVKMALPRR
jgi:hypothetical protein